MEGNTNGFVTAELSNWTGMGVRLPRIKVRDYPNRSEFQRQAVYILFGKNEANEDAAYIGEAENVYSRLQVQLAEKEFWNEVVFFCSKDKYLNKASIKYLENRLYAIAVFANRYALSQNVPAKPEMSEPEQAELEEFLSNIKLLTASLGYKIFEALEETVTKPVNTSPSEKGTLDGGKNLTTSNAYHILTELLFCKNYAGAEAAGLPSTEGFLVYKNAVFMKEAQPSLHQSILIEPQKMIDEGVLTEEDRYLRLQEDYVFTSSSRAAAMILGVSASGPREWKTKDGISLKELEAR